MKVYAVLLCLVLSTTCAQEDQEFDGLCPEVQIKENFNENEFAGTWYEIKRFVNGLITGDCGNPLYTTASNGFTLSFPTRNINENTTATLNMTLKQQIVLPTPGKYNVYVNDKQEEIPHFILDTDYKTYSVIWGCSVKGNKNKQRLFIYSRQPNLSNDVVTSLITKLDGLKIDTKKLQDVEQDDGKCERTSGANFIYPSIISTVMIVLFKIVL